jgi:hypothetical protein
MLNVKHRSGAMTDRVSRHNERVTKKAERKGRELSEAEKREVVSAVLMAMAEGETLAEASADEGVGAAMVRRWMAADPAVMGEYMAVKRLQAQAWAEEAIQVARDSTNQSATKDRLLVDTLKWAAAKASPAEFGDRQTVEHQGAQEIKVRVVEDEMPTLAVRQGVESVVLAGMQTAVPLLGTGEA